MKANFNPVLNKIYVIEKYTFFILVKGNGLFQVDFLNYSYTANRVIFLSPGQYFQLLSGGYSIFRIEFPNETVAQIKNARYLFKHIISLGQIEINPTKIIQPNQLTTVEINENNIPKIHEFIKQWESLNPFNVSNNDLVLLFEMKEIIDEKFREPFNVNAISRQLNEKPYHLNLLLKEKLNNTLRKLASDKLLLEAKRKVAFSDLTTKEIAYEFGFKDPTYFNRFFKLQTQLTPTEFRDNFEYDERDTFISDLILLINSNYKEHHTLNFYASELNISVNALAQKTHKKINLSLKSLIVDRILCEAKAMLVKKIPINVIGFELGFKEPNHFSAFFKQHTGKIPSEY